MPKCVAGWRLDPRPLARLLMLAMMALDGSNLLGRRSRATALARKLPDIRWQSNNSIFDISNTEHVKRVHLLDRVTLLCPPSRPPDDAGGYEHSKLFMVSREAYEQCVLRGGERQLGVCSSPERQASITLVFRQFSPLPSAFTFQPGHSYFVITTSNGSIEGLNNTQGGLCETRNMRLKFDVMASASGEEDETPEESVAAQQSGHHHNTHGRHSHHSKQSARHQPNEQQNSDGSDTHHPPFLYVIHTVDTPLQDAEDERAQAWGQHNERSGQQEYSFPPSDAACFHQPNRPFAIASALFAILLPALLRLNLAQPLQRLAAVPPQPGIS